MVEPFGVVIPTRGTLLAGPALKSISACRRPSRFRAFELARGGMWEAEEEWGTFDLDVPA